MELSIEKVGMVTSSDSDQNLDVAYKDHMKQVYKKLSIVMVESVLSSDSDQDLDVAYTNHIEQVYKGKLQEHYNVQNCPTQDWCLFQNAGIIKEIDYKRI